MKKVTIAHLSDLHFGIKTNHSEAWEALSLALLKGLAPRPSLLLVTGDIVDSPKDKHYLSAKTALDALQIKYFVCAGNHDRHFRGNILPFPFRRRHHRLLFDSHFKDNALNCVTPVDHPLEDGSSRWKLRLLGLDSSLDADRFARGFVKSTDIQHLEAAMSSVGEFDMAILLVHHHLLPIRSLEIKRRDNVKDLANATAMVNSGLLLDKLASIHVDLALHGHEHASNWGSYKALAQKAGQTAVVAAGSATGVASVTKCEVHEATFNLIELGEDRSVNIVVYENKGTGFVPRERVSVIPPVGLRKSSFLRRSMRTEKPTSEIVKFVKFTSNRDIQVHERATSWILERQWSRVVRNSTGVPVDPIVQFEGAGGRIHTVPDAAFETGPEDHSYLIECDVPLDLQGGPVSLDLRYTWMAGGLLTSQEVAYVSASGAPGYLRRDGYEFASVSPKAEVMRAELIVSMPIDFAPLSSDVRVEVRDDHGKRVPHEESELQGRLRILDRGHMSLSVPFPRRDFRYIIAWKPRPLTLSPGAVKDIGVLRQNGREAAKILAEDLRKYLPTIRSVGIYVPDLAAQSLELVSFDGDGPTPANKIAAVGDQSALGQAWWGTGVVSPVRPTDDAAELGYVTGESALLAFPMYAGGGIDGNVRGVVRVGLSSAEQAGKPVLDPEEGTTLQAKLVDSVLRMLYVVRSKGA